MYKIVKTIGLAIAGMGVFAGQGFGQDTTDLLGQVSNLYVNNNASAGNLIAGFSFAGLFAGILFGCIGFVAFMYGKKNAEFRPMILGILLMGYPCFLRDTVPLYAVGAVLTGVLFFWRE